MKDWLNVWLAKRKPFQFQIPLAYLDGFDLDFAQVHFLDLQKCCWLVHLEAYFSEAGLGVQTHQIFHLFFLLNEATEINALCSGIRTQLQLQSNMHLIIWSSTLSWPGGLERLGTFSDCSGVPKMFEAILWGFLDAAASSSYPPNRLLEPPPGGRKTLQKTRNVIPHHLQPSSNCFDGLHSYVCNGKHNLLAFDTA